MDDEDRDPEPTGETIDLEPTDEDVIEVLERKIGESPDGDIGKREAYRTVMRAFKDGETTKKDAYVFVLGHVTDDVAELFT